MRYLRMVINIFRALLEPERDAKYPLRPKDNDR